MGPRTVPARGKGSIFPHFRTLFIGIHALGKGNVGIYPSLSIELIKLIENGHVCTHHTAQFYGR